MKRAGRVEMRLGGKWTLRAVRRREGHCRHRVGVETDLTPSTPGAGNPRGKMNPHNIWP